MAESKPKSKFRGSDANIALMLTTAKFLGQKWADDATVSDVLRRFSIDSIITGPQIGTGDILYNILDDEIANMQKIDQAIKKIDGSSGELSEAESREYEQKRAQLIAALENLEKVSEQEKREIIRRLLSAPNKKDYREYIDKFTRPIEAIEQRTEKLGKEAEALLTAIQNVQQTKLSKYKRLFNGADGDMQKSFPLPSTIADWIKHQVRMKRGTTQNQKPQVEEQKTTAPKPGNS